MKKLLIFSLLAISCLSFVSRPNNVDLHSAFHLPSGSNFSVLDLGDGNVQVTIFYENLKPMEESVLDQNGLLNGAFRKWSEDGNLLVSWGFKKNKLHGVQRAWKKDGSLKYKTIYFEGRELVIE